MTKVVIGKMGDGRTNLYNGRFYASKRTDIAGRTRWYVYDIKANNYSTLMCFGSYRLKKDCEWAIQRAVVKSDEFGINI